MGKFNKTLKMHVACMKGIQVSNKKPYISIRLTGDNNTCTLVIIFSRLKNNFNQSLLKEKFWEIHVLIKIYSCPKANVNTSLAVMATDHEQ